MLQELETFLQNLQNEIAEMKTDITSLQKENMALRQRLGIVETQKAVGFEDNRLYGCAQILNGNIGFKAPSTLWKRIKEGRFPAPDARNGDYRLWLGSTLNNYIKGECSNDIDTQR